MVEKTKTEQECRRNQKKNEDLKQANRRLEKALAVRKTKLSRDAAILRFRLTFELAQKTLQLYLNREGIKCQSPREYLREAGRFGLLPKSEGTQKWFDFLEYRWATVCAYNEDLADQIYDKAKEFSQEVADLLDRLS